MPPAHNKENELPDRLNLPAEMHALDGDELAEEQMRRTAELAKALHKETKGGKVLLSTADNARSSTWLDQVPLGPWKKPKAP